MKEHLYLIALKPTGMESRSDIVPAPFICYRIAFDPMQAVGRGW
jgi:hypothetical protein